MLAVDERVRYGPLKAGTTAGQARSKCSCPVCYLVAAAHSASGSAPVAPVRGPQETGPQAPVWWDESHPDRPDSGGHHDAGQQVLPGLEQPADRADPDSGLVDAVLGSPTLAGQVQPAGRAASTRQVREALVALLPDPAHRRPLGGLPGVSGSRARGAFVVLQRILNVEGLPGAGLGPGRRHRCSRRRSIGRAIRCARRADKVDCLLADRGPARKQRRTGRRHGACGAHRAQEVVMDEQLTMLIGPARDGALLEIGVLDLDADDPGVIHTMSLRARFHRFL